MEPIAAVHYGCGIYVPNLEYIKPNYHPTRKYEWIETLQSMNPKILAAENVVSESYYAIEGLYQTRLWAIDQNHNYSEIDEEYSGCILPLGRQPKLFGGIGHSYQSAIDALQKKYGKYLVDDFDYEEHFVKYEIIEF